MIDPSIALNVKTPQFADPLEQAGRAMNLLAMRQQIQAAPLHQQLLQQQADAGAMENTQRQLDLEDQQKMRKVYAESGGDPEKLFPMAVRAGVGPKTLIATQEGLLKMATAKAALSEKDLANHAAKNDALNALMQPVIAEADPQKQAALWDQQQQEGLRQGILTPQEVQAHPYPGSPDGVKQYAAGLATDKWVTSQAALQRAKAAQQQADTSASTAPTTIRKNTLEADELQRKLDMIQKTTPADVMALVDQVVPPGVKENTALNARTKAMVTAAMTRGDVQAAQDAIKTASAEMRQLEIATDPRIQAGKVAVTVAGAQGRAQATLDAGGMTEDDFQRAGEQYGRTGIMPPMGRDTVTRAKIEHAKNEWARDNGFKPADLITMQAAYQGDKDSLKKFQTQRDQIVSFEQTAQKNLDLFLDAASKIPDTGSPWLNLPLRNLDERLVGSANMAAVNAARQVANNEIAKVTSGGGLSGVLSDSARHEVEAYNPKDATLNQTLAVAKVLKQDMANRHQSMDATLGDIKQRIGGGGAPATQQPEKPPAAGGSYAATATGKDGHKIGTNDGGKTWFDVQTGKKI